MLPPAVMSPAGFFFFLVHIERNMGKSIKNGCTAPSPMVIVDSIKTPNDRVRLQEITQNVSQNVLIFFSYLCKSGMLIAFQFNCTHPV